MKTHLYDYDMFVYKCAETDQVRFVLFIDLFIFIDFLFLCFEIK